MVPRPGPLLGTPGYTWSHPHSFIAPSWSGRRRRAGVAIDLVQREVLDAYEVDAGLLTGDVGVAVSLMPNPYRAAEFARAHNDWLAERWLAAEPRLRGSILVPAQDPLAAAAEIGGWPATRASRRCCWSAARSARTASRATCRSSRPRPSAACRSPSTPARRGMGISTSSGGAGYPSFYIEWHTLGSGCSIMAHLVSLLCHGTFERVPGLRVMMMEGGLAWLPGVMWRLDTNWRGLRAEVPWVTRRPSEVLREHIRFTTQPLEHTDGNDELLWQMLEAVGAPDILCFASDYPHWDFDPPDLMIGRLPAEWRERVMHDNAAELFGARLGRVAA